MKFTWDLTQEDPRPAETRRRTLLLLGLILLVAILKPGIEAGFHMVFSQPTPVMKGEVFSVPRGWLTRKQNGEFQLWKPCLTVFCRSVTNYIRIQDAQINGDLEDWRSAAEETLTEQGYGSPNRISSGNGKALFECLEAKKSANTEAVISICYDHVLDIQMTFVGNGNNLTQFYMLTSHARIQ